MHEIAKHDFIDIEATYKNVICQAEKEIMRRFYKMHVKRFWRERNKSTCERND